MDELSGYFEGLEAKIIARWSVLERLNMSKATVDQKLHTNVANLNSLLTTVRHRLHLSVRRFRRKYRSEHL
jgi:hypothetical protein